MELYLIFAAALYLMIKSGIVPFAMQVQTPVQTPDDVMATLNEAETLAMLEGGTTIDDVLAARDDEKARAEREAADAAAAAEAEKQKNGEGTPAAGATAPAAAAPAASTPPVTPPAPAAKKPGEEGYLYAGKYKSVDDMKKGFVEIGKPLNISEKILTKTLQYAEKTGDWTGVEEMYSEMQEQMRQQKRNPNAAPAQTSASAAPTQDTPPATPEGPTKEQLALMVALQDTVLAVKESSVAKRLAKAGYTIPDKFMMDSKVTREFIELLKDDSRIEALELQQLIKDTVMESRSTALQYLQAEDESKSALETEKEAGKSAVKKFAETNGITVTDEEVDALVNEALASGYSFEDRNGVRFVRKDAVLQHYYATRAPAIIEQVKLATAAKARQEAIDDMKKLQRRTPSGISTNPIPSQQKREQAATVDVNDPMAVAGLSEAEVDALLKAK